MYIPVPLPGLCYSKLNKMAFSENFLLLEREVLQKLIKVRSEYVFVEILKYKVLKKQQQALMPQFMS